MAIGNYNAAYDLSLFDESLNASSAVPKRRADGEAHQQNRKRQNRRNQVMKLPEEELNKIRRRKRNPLQIAMGATGAAVVTFVIGIIIVGQVQLTELNQQIITAEKTLADTESLYVQNQMKVEAAHTNAEIEKYATEVLGMSKASSSAYMYCFFTRRRNSSRWRPTTRQRCPRRRTATFSPAFLIPYPISGHNMQGSEIYIQYSVRGELRLRLSSFPLCGKLLFPPLMHSLKDERFHRRERAPMGAFSLYANEQNGRRRARLSRNTAFAYFSPQND